MVLPSASEGKGILRRAEHPLAVLEVEPGPVVADEECQLMVAILEANLDARDLARPREFQGVEQEACDRLAQECRVRLDRRQAGRSSR
jgi:hypothetical protein